jgi:hypothetical protein
MNRHWRAAIAVVWFAIPFASAQGEDAPAAGNGRGTSYWGEIPAPSDSTTAAFENHSPSTLALVADVPYYVVGFPLRVLSGGIGATVVFLDEKRVIYKISRLLRPRELPYGLLVGFTAGGLTGLGGGVTFLHDEFFGEDNRFRLGARTSRNGHHRVVAGTRFGVGHARSLQLGAGYRMTPNARFFGIGPESRTAGNPESFFRQELTWAGGTVEQRLAPGLRADLDLKYTSIGARGPREEDKPSLAEAYEGSLPVGYRDRSHGVSVGLGVVADNTTTHGRPGSGGFHRAIASYYQSMESEDEDPSFWTYRLESQWFLSLWRDTRTVALRGFYSWIDPIDGNVTDIPFQRLMTNDDPDLLRGYEDFRWRDRGMAALTLEYRWPVWAFWKPDGAGIDAYAFGDIGQVFGDHDDLSVDDLTESAGFGFRFLGLNGFAGRLEFAWSDDDRVIRLRGDQLFQYRDGDLFHGRNPVPLR